LLHGQAAAHANAFGDGARELRERGLEAAQGEGARIEDERARLVMVALEAFCPPEAVSRAALAKTRRTRSAFDRRT
jgi:hypothetical protein